MIRVPPIDPVAIHITEQFGIKWYSIAYIAAILIVSLLIKKIIVLKKIKIKPTDIDEYIFYFVIGMIVGARLFYCIFYGFDYYINYPIEILKIYNGGQSFHGAIIGICIASYFFCKKNKINFLMLADLVSLFAPIGIFFGRMANFINNELIGVYTNSNFGVILPGELFPRHPSQIYESITEGVLLLIINMTLAMRTDILKYRGRLFSIFLILYSIFRFCNEFFRQPDWVLKILGISFSAGQLFSLPMLIAGIVLFVYTKNVKIS